MKNEKHISNRGPRGGTRWFRSAAKHHGFVVQKPAETRHVVDRTLGGDVIYVSGRWSRFAHKQQVSLLEWLEWANDAREVVDGR